MKQQSQTLRNRMKDVLSAVERGESVTLLYRANRKPALCLSLQDASWLWPKFRHVERL